MEYIKIPRDITEQKWYRNANARILFLHLLLIADEQGQIQVGIRTLAKEQRLSYQSTRTALSTLVANNVISALVTQPATHQLTQPVTQPATHHNTTITIYNYESYRCKEKSTNASTNAVSNAPTNAVNNANEEKNKTKKEEIPPHPPIEEKNKTKKEERLTDKTSLSVCQFDKQTDLPNVTKNENIDWDEIVLFFNEKIKNKSIPPIKLMTDRRKQAVRARIREYGFEAIKTAIINAAQSEFMNGRNRKNWTATFDWIFLPNNFPKVLEDNYKNKDNTYGTSTTGSGYISRHEQQEQERLERQRSAYRLMQRLAAEDGGDPLPPLEQ